MMFTSLPFASRIQKNMALRKYIPAGDAPSVSMKPLNLSSKVHGNAQLADPETSHTVEPDVDIDLREVYFLIMHFLSAGPCQRTYGQFWNELLEHQLLPRRYHAWYSRNGVHSGDENDDGLSFPLSYNKLVERYTLCFLILFRSLGTFFKFIKFSKLESKLHLFLIASSYMLFWLYI